MAAGHPEGGRRSYCAHCQRHFGRHEPARGRSVSASGENTQPLAPFRGSAGEIAGDGAIGLWLRDPGFEHPGSGAAALPVRKHIARSGNRLEAGVLDIASRRSIKLPAPVRHEEIARSRLDRMCGSARNAHEAPLFHSCPAEGIETSLTEP